MAAPITDNTVVTPPIAEATTALADQLGNIENVVTLTMQQYTLGSLILMVSYGACFAFILFFLMSVQNLAPRYRLVPILSAVVMASAGLSLLQEFSLWKDSYAFVDGLYRPLAENETFTNAYRYGNWTITVPILLTQLAIALGLRQGEIQRRSLRMGVPAVLMIWTGLYGQFGEVGDFSHLNLWGVVSSIFFLWLILEVRQTLIAGISSTPDILKPWPNNLWWFFLATWGLYPIAYALPQLGATAEIVIARQGIYSLADIASKLIYGIILARFVLRRSAYEGYMPAAEALASAPEKPNTGGPGLRRAP
ncbi:bacteriorhodopsin [Citromicrobium bathyomarinum]|jgi:bacteriorhodopsin|uniref:bacteriorhodopsin n=1 Tax=Sphingomonadales TaxID=204457 RepID=UPI000C547089|nr:bacteriorhodopsin [Citromicrobium sp.]MBO80625.1 rhodopsin [Citromicrobium sp.]|tara:strand:+ start:13078 stop:14001 length:924 start_codon:yes stop_codon:yes gene_type:complete